MDRSIPCGSKICAKRMQERRHEMHRERVRTVKSLVDTSEPMVIQMDHVRNNLKKEQMLEERYSEIDRENRILLKKMAGIMRQQVVTPRENRTPGPQSLNRDARKKELLRITKENQSILKRIQQAQPVYNHVEWEGSHRRNGAYLKNCGEYPMVLRSARGNASSELVQLSSDLGGEDLDGGPARGSPKTAMHQDGVGLIPEETKYVLKEGKMIGDTYYLVEMTTDGRTLSISVYNGDAQTTLELVLKERIHRQLYRETNGDYAQIASRLRVEGDRLVLEGLPPSTPATGSSNPPRSRGSGQGRQSPEELDAEAMVVHKAKLSSAGSVKGEIDLNSSTGDVEFRVRGFSPSSSSRQQTPLAQGR